MLDRSSRPTPCDPRPERPGIDRLGSAPRLAARGLALDGRGLAGLHDLLEAPEVVLELDRGFLAEEPGERDPEGAGGGLVVELDGHLGAAAPRGGAEPDRAGVVDLGVPEGAPRDYLARLVGDDLGVPLDL